MLPSGAGAGASGLHPVVRLGWRPLCSVVCNGLRGEFLGGHDRDMFIQVTSGHYSGLPLVDVSLGGCIMTCSQFERCAGRELSKKWKESIHVVGEGEGSRATLLSWLKRQSESQFGGGVVGQKVWVCWCADAEYYQGTIVSYNKDGGKHTVQYSSRLAEDLHLPVELISFDSEKPPIPPPQGPAVSAPPAMARGGGGTVGGTVGTGNGGGDATTMTTDGVHGGGTLSGELGGGGGVAAAAAAAAAAAVAAGVTSPLWHQGSGISVTSSYGDELRGNATLAGLASASRRAGQRRSRAALRSMAEEASHLAHGGIPGIPGSGMHMNSNLDMGPPPKRALSAPAAVLLAEAAAVAAGIIEEEEAVAAIAAAAAAANGGGGSQQQQQSQHQHQYQQPTSARSPLHAAASIPVPPQITAIPGASAALQQLLTGALSPARTLSQATTTAGGGQPSVTVPFGHGHGHLHHHHQMAPFATTLPLPLLTVPRPPPPPGAGTGSSEALAAAVGWMHDVALTLDNDISAADERNTAVGSGSGGNTNAEHHQESSYAMPATKASPTSRFQALLGLLRATPACLEGIYDAMVKRYDHFSSNPSLQRRKMIDFVLATVVEAAAPRSLFSTPSPTPSLHQGMGNTNAPLAMMMMNKQEDRADGAMGAGGGGQKFGGVGGGGSTHTDITHPRGDGGGVVSS